MKKMIKSEQLQALVEKANGLKDIHGVNYAFTVNRPLAGESYSLSHDDHVIMKGTKKSIYDFLKAFIKVISAEY